MARFYTNGDNQLIEKCANEQSAMKDSAIVKYDYAGMPLMIREYKGESYKNATEFTPIETYFSTFVYDFVEKVYSDSGTFYVQPLTVADKSMIVKLPIFTKRLL
jgi:hypothetical protein